MSLKVHHLNCATMCPYNRRLMAGEGGWLEPSCICAHCLLIESSEGLVLVDTGLGTDDIRNPGQLGGPFRTFIRPALRMEETALEQIRALGFKAEDVRHIVPTHLDVDHAGGLPDFPEAKVHIFERELDAALKPHLLEKARYVQSHWAHGPDWVRHKVEGDKWFGFEAIRAVPGLDPDVMLIPLLGHTRGHCGVAVRQGERWLIHCGDAYFFWGEVETPPHCTPGLRFFQNLVQVNGPKRLHNQRRLQELAAAHSDEVELFCAHDMKEFRRYAA